MPVPYTLAEIASRLGGRVVGNADTLIRQVGSLEHAGADQITFFSHLRYKRKLEATRAGAVVLGNGAQSLTVIPRIVCENPYAYFARVSQLFNPALAPEPGRHPTAQVSAAARVAASARIDAGAIVEDQAHIEERVWVGAGCHVGHGSSIGEDSRLYPGAVVYHECQVGRRAIIHSGAVIGADGFGVAEDVGQWIKIPQIGGVIIGDDVEIGANTTIDRGAIDDTIVEDGVKLDNQVQIGHNVRIGAHSAIAGCVGIAGSASIGRHCTIGGAAVILGHLKLADRVNVSAGTLISRSINQPGTYTGVFPFDHNASWVRNAVLLRHLSDLADRVRALEKLLRTKEENG
ncbi:MAG: UDP-3-O-(3-hydroxymyristoyl)glucosamine N-acyltransferase [Burkholderiales bacterium]